MRSKPVTTAEINDAIRRQARENKMLRVGGLMGQHAVAVGLDEDVELQVIGEAGDFLGALDRKGIIMVEGAAGDYLGDNMEGGGIVVRGNVGKGAGTYMRSGIIVIDGDSGEGAGTANTGGTIIIGGKAGEGLGLLQSGGTLIVCGDVEGRFGHLMIGGKILIGGEAGTPADFLEEKNPTEEEMKDLRIYFDHYGLGHDPEKFRKFVAREKSGLPTHETLSPGDKGRWKWLEHVVLPTPFLYSPTEMDFDLGKTGFETSVRIGEGRVKEPLVSSLPLLMDTPLKGPLPSTILKAFADACIGTGLPHIVGTGGPVGQELGRVEVGVGSLVCWGPDRSGMTRAVLSSCSGVILDIGRGISSELGAHIPRLPDGPKKEGGRTPPGAAAPIPYRHLDMMSLKDLKNHILLLKELTRYRVPVIVRMGAGHVHQDLKRALATGADSVIIDLARRERRRKGMGDRSGLGIFPVIRRIRNMLGEKSGQLIGVEIGELGFFDGEDLLKCIAMGADYVVMGCGRILSCGKCPGCERGGICRELSVTNRDVTGTKVEKAIGGIVGEKLEQLGKDLREQLVRLSATSPSKISPEHLYAGDYDTAAMTGLKLAGYDSKLPMWLH